MPIIRGKGVETLSKRESRQAVIVEQTKHELRIFVFHEIDSRFDWSKQNVNTDGTENDWLKKH